MKGYVVRKGNRWYAVIYEGIDPVTGRERRRWHAAGTERADAERLAARLVADLVGRNDQVRGLSFGAYLTGRWLPGKRVVLAASTYDGYRRNIERHIVPTLGRIGLRRLRPHHLEALYDRLLHPKDEAAALVPKTVYEVHLVIRGRSAMPSDEASWPATWPWSRTRLGFGRFRRSSSNRGPRGRSTSSSKQRRDTGTSPRFGSRPSPGCAATNCSACAGTTSTNTPRPSR